MSGQLWGPTGVLASGSGASPTFVGTDAKVNDSAGFPATISFAACNIGTPSATRVVVVGAAGYLGGGTGTITGISVGTTGGSGGTALTQAVATTSTGNPCALFYGVVTSGTSVEISITTSASWASCTIGVGALDHVTTAPTSIGSLDAPGSQLSPYLLSSITVPATGFGVTYCGVLNDNATITSPNTTIDQQANGTNITAAISRTAVAGAIQPTFNGGNFKVFEMVGATWGP